MSILDISVYPAPVLKQVAEKITRIDDEIRELADDMLETMYQAPGVGLAAPQVGRSIALIVADPVTDDDAPPEPMILINPEIISASGETAMVEGCLSVPDYSAEVSRYQKIVVKAQTLTEEKIEMTLEDFPAIVIQHEIDHLNGTLFIDRISRLKRNIFERKLKKGTLK
jgi:peptide deformylase